MCVLAVAAFGIALLTPAFSQQPAASSSQPPLDAETQKDRTYALDQVKEGKKLAVLDLLAKLHTKLPKDCDIGMALADAQISQSATLEGDAEKAERKASRKTYKDVVDAGCENDFANQMYQAIPEDGARSPFSDNADVERLVKKGEAAFGEGKYDEAKDWYIKAVVLDPKNFAAALYAGDAYFAKKDWVSACEWFKRASEIDPGQESAHRYWGDALMQRRMFADAKQQYIQAVIADPYSNFVYNGMNNYLRGTGGKAKWYKIAPQADVSQKDDKNINITLSPGNGKGDDPSGGAWMAYAISRAAYRKDDFAKDHPGEKEYRHSMQEEAKALSLAVEVATGDKKNKNPLPDDLARLVELKKGGFLEPYVLLNVPDGGVVQDYPAYRTAHRDVLERYLADFVLPAAPPDGKTE